MIGATYGLGGQAGVSAEESPRAGTMMAAPSPPAPEAAAPAQLQLRLLGTVAAGENGIAICLDPATGGAIRLRVGENFEGWTLRSVQGHRATFEKASQRAELAISSPDAGGQGAPLPLQAIGAVPSSVQPVRTTTNAPVSGTWMDGDGQLIAPPPKSR
jgi:hypothetical protein